MSKFTPIQWCDDTANPCMGCDGCELFPNNARLATAIMGFIEKTGYSVARIKQEVRELLSDRLASDNFHAREMVAATIIGWLPDTTRDERRRLEPLLAHAIAVEFKCYAGLLHLWRGVNEQNPGKWANPGYAPKFEIVTKYPGRMKKAAAWNDLRGTRRLARTVQSKIVPARPWLDGLRRLIFVSDMADLLSESIDFEYIKQEVIDNVISPKGRRHIWLWLTKRPARMAEISEQLIEEGIGWPDNLVAMTSVTSRKTLFRVDQLRKVNCRYRGLSIEPLWEQVTVPLQGIDWLIAGGESALRRADAAPFDLAWARDLREQCRLAGVPFFMKQFGGNPTDGGIPLRLKDGHGGDWSEWPKDLRVRKFPASFRR